MFQDSFYIQQIPSRTSVNNLLLHSLLLQQQITGKGDVENEQRTSQYNYICELVKKKVSKIISKYIINIYSNVVYSHTKKKGVDS